jgi:ABC-type transporter Mla MlaB component
VAALTPIEAASQTIRRGIRALEGSGAWRANDRAMPEEPTRYWVEPPIGARRYHTLRVQGAMTDEQSIHRLIQSAEGLIDKPVFAMHLDLTGVAAADSKLLSALVYLIRKAGPMRIGVTIGLPESISTMASVYRVAELLRPHIIQPTA